MMSREREIGMTIKQLSNFYTRFMDKARKNANRKVGSKDESITRLQGWIIDYLYVTAEPVFQKDIETEFSIRHSTVSKTLKHMEEAGLVLRTIRDGDARYKLISLTESAKRNHPLAAAEFLRAEEKATEGIRRKDLDTFLSVAGKIIKNLEK
jgi:Transcriptional regulators